nr:MAG TPA: hypothetical protein [Caudoviricetes sp.]
MYKRKGLHKFLITCVCPLLLLWVILNNFVPINRIK